MSWPDPGVRDQGLYVPRVATLSENDVKTHKTGNNLNSNAKSVAIELLNARVADCIDLALLTKQDPVDIYSIPDHLHALIERYGTAANNVRPSIDQADETSDADIFTEVSRSLDKALWFLERTSRSRVGCGKPTQL